MICNEDDTDGRARVTVDEERVLHVDWAHGAAKQHLTMCNFGQLFRGEFELLGEFPK